MIRRRIQRLLYRDGNVLIQLLFLWLILSTYNFIRRKIKRVSMVRGHENQWKDFKVYYTKAITFSFVLTISAALDATFENFNKSREQRFPLSHSKNSDTKSLINVSAAITLLGVILQNKRR